MLYIFIINKKQTLGVIIDNIPIFRNNILGLGLIQWVRIRAPARTTRITDGKLQYHGKKCEDRCSHFRKNAWNRLRFFLKDRYVLHLISPEKIFSSQGTDCPEIGHDRARLLFLKTWTTPIFVHLKYIRLHSTLKLLMFYDGVRIVLTISIIGNDINTLIRSEEQKN